MNTKISFQFANALDENDFDAAVKLLHNQCTYSIHDTEMVGADDIIDSYRKADAWCKETLDAYEYESSVDEEGVITFYDHITHGGLKHTHCCQQKITLDGDGLIAHIEHIELPNERESINAFFKQVGVQRNK